MIKKIVIVIIAIITITNVVSAVFLYSDLISLKVPDTTIKIGIIDLDSKEILINASIEIVNTNDFQININNLELVTTTPEGEIVAHLKIDGGNISPQETKTFNKVFSVDFNGNNPNSLKTSLKGAVGIKSWLIQKTLPLSINVITDLGDIIAEFALPMITTHVDFGEITQNNINISILANVYNPNNVEVEIDNILIKVMTDQNESVGELELVAGLLPAKGYLSLNGEGTIVIEALNAKELIVNLTTKATVKIADFDKSLPLIIESTFSVPDLKTLLPSKLPTTATIRGDMRFTPKGLIDVISLETYNPNKIEFVAKDITFSLYRVDGATKKLLGQAIVEEGVIKAEAITILNGTLLIPFLKILLPPSGGKFIPDWLELDAMANVTIKGLNNYVWIGVIAYSDIHPLRVDKVYTSPIIIS